MNHITGLLTALADLGIDTTQIAIGDLTPEPAAPRTCHACSESSEIRVTTGVRWVCLDCAVTGAAGG